MSGLVPIVDDPKDLGTEQWIKSNRFHLDIIILMDQIVSDSPT